MSLRSVRVVKEMKKLFVEGQVTRSSAALSYYLTISVFPFLVCVSAILGSLEVYEMNAFAFLADAIPNEAFSVIKDFFGYAGRNRSELLVIIGIIATLTSSSAAFRSFTGIMGEIQGEMRFTGIWKGIVSIVFSIVFMVVIYASALIILSGGWLMQILETYFGLTELLALWAWIRFVILFLLLFIIIFGVYLISAPRETKRTQRLPGAFAASIVLVVASLLFSRLISVSLRFELLYGSLASFVILMVWLYLCGIILIMGNVLNIALNKHRPKPFSA